MGIKISEEAAKTQGSSLVLFPQQGLTVLEPWLGSATRAYKNTEGTARTSSQPGLYQ